MAMTPHLEPAGTSGTLIAGAPAIAPAGGQAGKSRSMLRRGWEVFAENKMALAGLGFVVFIILFSFVGPLIYKTQQTSVSLSDAYCTPGARHLLGCDNLGYDTIGRLMVGGQNSIEVGLAAAAAACLFGSVYGAVSGFLGGVIDSFLMRIVDALLSIPIIFVLIILSVFVHPNAGLLIVFIAIGYWPGPARLVRGETLTLRTREYVQAVRVVGGRNSRAVLRHVMPNAMGTIIVLATFAVADSILTLSSLGFLGFGIELPSTDWGTMLSNGLTFVNDGYWWLIYPAGIIIIVTVVAFNFIGDALRDAFETRLQRR
ncbi:MAG TPA: ABC transporter permease [Streptosporangiaceae bacterium]|jgi:peptide/nickel transport system permease protein